MASFEEQWEEMFAALKGFKKAVGHCNVPKRFPENVSLGLWCQRQRRVLNNGRLSDLRKDRLTELGFVWDPLKGKWEQMFEKLSVYKKLNGHCNIPQKHNDDVSLGIWCQKLRVEYKYGKLNAERLELLGQLDFEWEPNRAHWEEMLRLLSHYKDKYNHCNVPRKYPTNPTLSRWVSTQRKVKKQSKLSKERIHRLDELGFVWDVRDQKWEEMYRSLVDFEEKFGHCSVPRKYTAKPSLSRWCNRQRNDHRIGALSETRYAQLVLLCFWQFSE